MVSSAKHSVRHRRALAWTLRMSVSLSAGALPAMLPGAMPGVSGSEVQAEEAKPLDLGRQTGISDERSAQLYTEYQRANLNLKPLAQIDAWLGYLKLHPESPYREQVRWRIRYLAANLSERDERQLLSMLAFQQLPDSVMAQETPEQKALACAEFVRSFPELFDNGAYANSFLKLAMQVGVKNPQQLVAKNLHAAVPWTPVAERPVGDGKDASVVVLRTPDAAERPSMGVETSAGTDNGSGPGAAGAPSSEAAKSGTATSMVASSGANAGAGDAASASAGASAGASSGNGTTSAATAGATQGGSSEVSPKADGRTETAVASIPSAGANAAEGARDEALSPAREAERFARWTTATEKLSAEARMQMWTTYLLLYPNTPHLEEISRRIAEADVKLSAEKQQAAVIAERLAALEAQNSARQVQEQMQRERDDTRRTFRRVLGATGGLLLFVLLISAL